MAQVTKTRTYITGNTLTAAYYNADRDEIIAGVNSIDNTQIAAAAAIAYSKLNLTGSILNADINAAAAIAYSKLNLTGSILNADVNAAAAIVYSKLNLTGNILNADIAAAAAIAESKIAFGGTAGQHVTSDGDGTLTWAALTINRAFSWYVLGTLTTGTNYGARYVAPQAMTIVKCWLIVRTAPTGAAILIDIHKNGTTIWTTQGNRATIAATATAGNTTTFDVTALAAGDYLDLDIDQIGSTVAGVDLTIVLEVSQP